MKSRSPIFALIAAGSLWGITVALSKVSLQWLDPSWLTVMRFVASAPILGPGPMAGLIYATGHHRNGILLAPVTADAMARLILDDVTDPAIKPFGLERFLPARAAE